jgi:hypothetical protein
MDGPPSDHFEKMLDGPCPNHAGPVKHRYRDCALLKKFFQGRLEGVSAPAPAGNANPSFPDDVECLMIFGGLEAHASKRQVKLFEREVYAATPTVPEFLRWSETAITFDRNDHPDYVPQPGKLPLVVSPIVGTKRLTRVLMDGGSGLNILYASTLDKMGISRSQIRPERSPFYGVVPGKEAYPLGEITLPVTFGDRNNYRTEHLGFEVLDFPSSYYALLGRPCYAKFMAVPNYVYLKLKMLGPNGVITVGASPQEAYQCDKENCELAAALIPSAELAQEQVELDKALAESHPDGPAPKRMLLDQQCGGQFTPSGDTKKVPLDPQGSGSKTVVISSSLSDK